MSTTARSFFLLCLFASACLPHTQPRPTSTSVPTSLPAPSDQKRRIKFKCLVMIKTIKSRVGKKKFQEIAKKAQRICQLFPGTQIKIKGTERKELKVSWSKNKKFFILINPNTGIGIKEFEEETKSWIQKARKKGNPALKTSLLMISGLLITGGVIILALNRETSPTRKEAENRLYLDALAISIIAASPLFIVSGIVVH